MKKYNFATLMALAALALCSCDDGRIEEKTVSYTGGRTVTMEGTLSGLQNWGEDQYVAIAGFDGTDEYAVITKRLPDADGPVSVQLTGIPDNVTNVQLCVLDRLRRHVMTFRQIDLAGSAETTAMDVGTVDVSMLNAIQQGYFNTTCANCHGASNFTAAGLNLTEGHSYQALVGQPSTKVDGLQLVEPGNARQSVLHQVLNTELTQGWREYHLDMVSEKNAQSLLPLIDSWIDAGAPEK